MKKLLWILIFFATIIPASTNAQESDYYNSSFLRYENHIYKESIKTPILERLGFSLSDPVLQLGNTDVLQLSFDDLSEDAADYGYRIIHCTKDWQPSVLSENDYTDGFYTGIISKYRPSFNTTHSYFHYTLDFPNEQMKVLLSGNYLMVVFENAEPDKIVLTQRFLVVENLVNIESNIHRATDVALRNSHQEVDVKLNTGGLNINNPYSSVQLVIIQNNLWSTAITNLKPRFVLDNELDYNYDDENIFQGGSEFRTFDIRTMRFLTQFIEKVDYDSSTNNNKVILKPAIRRGTQRYSSEDDINGRFLIKIYEDRNSEVEADYVKVRFSLPVLEPYLNGKFYLFGQLTNWNIGIEGKMEYDYDNSLYFKELLLKQGYYNYQYMFVPDSTGKPEIADTEGQHFETRNDYTILVYFREPGGRFDRIVGYRKTESAGN
jgi:hypothetical protein